MQASVELNFKIINRAFDPIPAFMSDIGVILDSFTGWPFPQNSKYNKGSQAQSSSRLLLAAPFQKSNLPKYVI